MRRFQATVPSGSLFLILFLTFFVLKVFCFRVRRRIWTALFFGRSGLDCDFLVAAVSRDFRMNSDNSKVVNSCLSIFTDLQTWSARYRILCFLLLQLK
jgi:hypothetical protein